MYIKVNSPNLTKSKQPILLIFCYLQAYVPIRINGNINVLNFLQNLAIAQIKVCSNKN
jgi:hypothetical protein